MQHVESLSLGVTIESLANSIGLWHAAETELRRQLDSMDDGAPDRERIQAEADALAEKVIDAEYQVSLIPARTALQAYLKLTLTAWRAHSDEREDHEIVERVMRDVAAFLEPMTGIAAQGIGLGDWLSEEI
jgi:hypothetical protein